MLFAQKSSSVQKDMIQLFLYKAETNNYNKQSALSSLYL